MSSGGADLSRPWNHASTFVSKGSDYYDNVDETKDEDGIDDEHIDKGDQNDDGVLLAQRSKISLRLIAFQFSNYQNIYSGYTRLWEGLYNMLQYITDGGSQLIFVSF